MNKKAMAAVALFCTICVSVLFTSCSDVDNPATSPESNPDQLADVTIMYYAHGGGNLDKRMIGNIRQMYRAEASSHKNVKIAIEFKFSAKDKIPHFEDETDKEDFENTVEIDGEEETESTVSDEDYVLWMDPEGSSTFRFALDPTKTLRKQAEGHYLPGKNADITNPDSLTNFINWAAKTCPAKNYVLILNDHGGGYIPDDDLYRENAAARTRGIIYDDANVGKHFSAPSLAHAIKAANIRPNVIYFDACLMNTIEYMFELKDVTDYVVASTYITYAGPPYATLIECLSGASDNLRYAFEKYIEYNMKFFDPVNEDQVWYYDITMTETAKLDQLGEAMREFTDRLCDTYQNGTAEQKQKIDDVTKNAVKINENSSLYDIGRYMEGMRKALPEVFDDAFWAELLSAFNNCIAGQYASKYLLNHDYQVDYSVLLAAKGVYHLAQWGSNTQTRILEALRYYYPDGNFITYIVKNGEFKKDVVPDYTLKLYGEGQWGGTLESVYGALAFEKATGWSRWLLLNEQLPPLWCNNDFNSPLPDPDPIE